MDPAVPTLPAEAGSAATGPEGSWLPTHPLPALLGRHLGAAGRPLPRRHGDHLVPVRRGNIGTIREAFGFTTQAVRSELPAAGDPTEAADAQGGHAGHGAAADEQGEHAEHGTSGEASGEAPDGASTAGPTDGTDPAAIDDVLAAGRAVNIDTGLVEILPPADADSAWVVQEIQRSYPTKVDAVAVDGATLEVLDRSDLAEQDLAAKLTRWGIDLHMGTMFGVVNQIVLFLIASTLVAMILWGYAMWWQRRPARGRNGPGRPPRRGALHRAPWWGVALVLLVALGIGLMLPLLGLSLAAFVLVDTIVGRMGRPSSRGGVSGADA